MPIDGYFYTPFATDGDKTTVPDEVQPDGSVSYEQGYPIAYSTPVGSGGYNITRESFNEIMYDITSAIQQYQQHGNPPWITSAMNCGSPYEYSMGDVLLHNKVVYQSLEDSNADEPPSSKWGVFAPFAAYENSMGIVDGTEYAPFSYGAASAGASKTYATADWGNYIRRSNSGSAMTDTLPGTSGALTNGWFTYVVNRDASASIVFSVGSGGAINQGNIGGSFIVLPGETWRIESYGSGNYNAVRVAGAVLAAAPVQSAVKNLVASWASNTTATITADEMVLEDTNGFTRKVSSVSLTFNGATTGANGLDTGSLANATWYYGYVIFNPTTGTTACLFSTSSSAPTLPSGYTYKSGVITAFYTSGSATILGFKQRGNDYQYVVGSNLSALRQMITGSSGSPTTPTWTAVAVGAFCPTAIASKIKLLLSNAPGSQSGGAAPNNSYGNITSATNPPPLLLTTGSIANQLDEFVLESTNVYYYAGGSEVSLFCLGFTINL